MARVLITGANGFGGRYLVNRLLKDGCDVVGVVHAGRLGVPDVAEHSLDLRDAQAVDGLIEAIQPDYVVHLAAVTHVAHQDIEELYRINIMGTRNLLNAVATYSPGIGNVIIASSGLVYGNQSGGVLNEAMAPMPVNDYGISKLACEQLARIYGARIPVISTRTFNYTGVGQSADFIVPKIVSHAARGATKIELGNIHVARDFSDVRTVVDAYARLLTCKAASGQTLNLCSGKATSILEIITEIEAISGLKLEVAVNQAFVRSNEVESLCGNKDRIEALLGPLKPISIRDTLQWMLESANKPLDESL